MTGLCTFVYQSLAWDQARSPIFFLFDPVFCLLPPTEGPGPRLISPCSVLSSFIFGVLTFYFVFNVALGKVFTAINEGSFSPSPAC